uniref:Centriolar coiled-coil protein 110 n=1 Tax=Cynoglossus semilaevis TaxID=244447 RepID=A0A3P8W3I9_CYNSE
MCGSPEMESYEEFCLRSLTILQEQRKFKKMTCEPPCSLKACSVIRFYGRAVLSPLLSEERRTEMCDHRERAVQREVDRQNQQRNKLLAQVQDILDQSETNTFQIGQVQKQQTCKSPVNSYTLVTDLPGPPFNPGFELQKNDLPPTTHSVTPTLNSFSTLEKVKMRKEEKSEDEEEEEEEEEEEDDDVISLDSLLKKSRPYLKKEQSQQGSKVNQTANTESICDSENKRLSPVGNSGVEFGFSLHHSPAGTPQTETPQQTLFEPSIQHTDSLVPCLPDRYARLPSPEFSISPCVRRRKPRPVSTGNIHISFPITPEDLIPRSPGRSGEGACMADWGETKMFSEYWDTWESESGCGFSSGLANHRSSNNVTSSPREGCSPVSTTVPSPMVHHNHPAAGFRRRCHTMDSQLHNIYPEDEHIDRSQERLPRFMAGVTLLGTNRRSSAVPLNQSYVIENPSPSLMRPHITTDTAHVPVKMASEDVQGADNGRMASKVLTNATETQAGNLVEQPQRRAHALEDMQRRLEEEHAMQMSLLLAEQEKEQQCLRLELEETGRKLKEQACVRPLSADSYGWSLKTGSDSCPSISPCFPGLSPTRTPSEQSSGHSLGFPSPISPGACPSVQPPVYIWGSARAGGKPRGRLSLVLTADQQRTFSRIAAVTRGFLTRRLLQTDKIKQLRQTIVDTQEFIRSFHSDGPQKKSSFTAQDLSLQERVKAQLRAALYDIHDIFFEMPLEDRLALLQQDREMRTERKLRDLDKNKSSKERVVLSAATQRSLDRKKRVSDSSAQSKKMHVKPKSPTTNRVLKPSQCQNSPVLGQLNRQGSWNRKTPEERVKRSENLKKQHSLG